MRRIITAITAVAFGGFISACAHNDVQIEHGAPFDLSKDQISWVEKNVRSNLKDPDSARFGGMKASVTPRGIITVCGYVNSKNSYGGYVGPQPFIGTLISGGGFALGGMGGTDIETRSTVQVCSQAGIEVGSIATVN